MEVTGLAQNLTVVLFTASPKELLRTRFPEGLRLLSRAWQPRFPEEQDFQSCLSVDCQRHGLDPI